MKKITREIKRNYMFCVFNNQEKRISAKHDIPINILSILFIPMSEITFSCTDVK